MNLPVRVIELVLPYPPRMNDYWRLFTPKGRGRPHMIVSEIGKAYKALVRKIARRRLVTFTGPLRFSVDVFRPRAAGDVDGHVKVLFDALQRDEEADWPGLYLNDSQGFRVAVEHWDHQPDRPRVQLTVTEDYDRRRLPEDWPISPAEQAEIDAAHEAMAEIRKKARDRRKAKQVDGPAAKPRAQRKAPFNEAPAIRAARGTLKQMAKPATYPPRKRGEQR